MYQFSVKTVNDMAESLMNDGPERFDGCYPTDMGVVGNREQTQLTPVVIIRDPSGAEYIGVIRKGMEDDDIVNFSLVR